MPTIKRFALVLGVLLQSVLWLGPATADDPLEYKLAVIDAGTYVPKDDITVARFKSLLGQLSQKYEESPDTIGDMTVKGQNMLREVGVAEKNISIMEGMNQIIQSRNSRQKYADLLVYYITLREQGTPHNGAIDSLRAILNATGIN